MTEERSRVFILVGIIALVAVAIIGIVVAILAGPDPSTGPGQVETGLSFSDDADPAQGPGEAKVIVRMFSDFQCPACQAAEPALQAIMKKYVDRVRFIWNDFPLTTIHQNALAASNAARCAEEQGKFWEMHDVLYARQRSWSDLLAPTAEFTKYAQGIGLNEGAFTACVGGNRHVRKIDNDRAEGTRNNVRATPTFFINNRRIEGAVTEAQWEQVLEAELSATSSTAATPAS